MDERTDRQMDKQTEKYTCYVWAGGTCFQLCCCVSFFGCGGNSFRWYLPTIPVVPLCLFLLRREIVFGCTGQFFWLWWEKVLDVTSLLIIPYQLCFVSIFWLRREIVVGYSVSKKDSYSVSLIERRTASKCVYFVISKLFYSVSLNSLSISCTRMTGNYFISILWRNISNSYVIPQKAL